MESTMMKNITREAILKRSLLNQVLVRKAAVKAEIILAEIEKLRIFYFKSKTLRMHCSLLGNTL